MSKNPYTLQWFEELGRKTYREFKPFGSREDFRDKLLEILPNPLHCTGNHDVLKLQRAYRKHSSYAYANHSAYIHEWKYAYYTQAEIDAHKGYLNMAEYLAELLR